MASRIHFICAVSASIIINFSTLFSPLVSVYSFDDFSYAVLGIITLPIV